MLIPLDFAVAVRHLDETHAAFEEPPRHQALPAEIFSHGIVDSVQIGASRAVSCDKSWISGIADCMRKASSNEFKRPSSA